MRRILACALSLIMLLALSPVCYADVDLSGMSYDELVALKDKINRAIWDSEEWQEVEVPQGVWAVGEDIPAGKWTIKAIPGGNAYIKVGDTVKDGGTDVKANYTVDIYDPGHRGYKEGTSLTESTVDLVAGQYVSINYANAIFMPYAGKPTLGFKR